MFLKSIILGGFMSRTYRNPASKNSIFRKPRHKGALVAASDEYGIRKKAIPPTDYDDIPVAGIHEDFHLYKLDRKTDKLFRDLRKERERIYNESIEQPQIA